jgi:hypothetical protein
MMAPRSSRRRRYAMTPAVTWLIKAFAPVSGPAGDPAQPTVAELLRSQATVRVRGPADRLTIVYDLPDGRARLRADQLVKSASGMKLVAIGAQVIRDIEATIDDDRTLLTVTVLLVRK